MNNKILIFITLILITIGFILFYQRNTPEKVTREFYTNWINYKGDPINDKLYKNTKLVTNNFISYVDSIKTYDPVLCNQSNPKEFKIENVLIHDNEASLIVIENFDQGIKNINVFLKKTGNKWKIDQIKCSEEETSSFTETNFKKQGNIILENSNIDFLYEEPGKPSIKTRLIFSSFSTCISSVNKTLNCDEIKFQTGDRVEVEGIKQNDILQVYSLLIIPPALPNF
ncbi:MAG TPA: DUF3828 domain-containing protein [Candidatus Pacearchaeota archaeon]|nr:DUF3828 domain-containing protein [Candidatus Pacearchaeota archaeon]